ncbi:MAG: cytochrome c biogenesis protein CcsA [Tepidisphaeraceae bacterium]
MPTTGQLALLVFAVALFAAGGAMSIARLWWDRRGLRIASRCCLGSGIVASIGVIVWHAVSQGRWVPIGDNFDALVWLATLLAMFVLYVQRHRTLGALDWFVMPLVILMLVIAAIVGRTDFHEYHPFVANTWSWVHRVTAYGGAVAFAIAAASGAMYVLASRRLRNKQSVGPQFGSLERLEHLTIMSVTLGFALLTVGMVTGGVKMMADRDARTPTAKIVLAVVVWLVYAVILHAPINPSFRGRKVAVLSVVGFVLMLGTIVAVLLMPGGTS